ncbi:hypothetical protein ACQ4PT_009824 [Festuca glaucescens]
MSVFSGRPLGRPGGRFWPISPSPDSVEDAGGGCSDSDGEVLADEDDNMGQVSSMDRDYFCKTPESDPRRNLEEPTSRMKRRLEKRREQQRIAFLMQESPVSSSVSFAGDERVHAIVRGRKKRTFKKPIMEPSTFVLEDELDAVSWTLVAIKAIGDGQVLSRWRTALVVEEMRQDKAEVRGSTFVEVIRRLAQATFSKEDIRIQGMEVAGVSKEISTTRPGGYGDFHPGAGGNDFFGGGNGNNGYRNHRRYEFRGTRPSGGANGGRGSDRNRSYNQEVETAVVQQKAGTGANLQQNQPPTVVQRNNTNVTFQPKKNTVKPTAVQQPPAKATTVQQKTSIQHTSDDGPGTSIGAGTVANQTKKKDKDPEKVKCFRCDIVGHFSIDCTATKEVDMAYTRRHGVVRSLVKVVDIALIPYQKEFWHEDECYLLTIELEEYDMAIDGEEPNLSPKKDDGNDDAGNNDKNTQSGSTKDKPNSDKQTEKHNDGSKTNKSGGVIINAPGAHTVNLDTAISFGSFCNTKVHDKEISKDGDVPTSCRRLFRTPPASPARSMVLPVHAGTRSEPSERATDASDVSAIACDEAFAAAPKDADKLAAIQPTITANCSPTAANFRLGSRANAETTARSGVLGATTGVKPSTVFVGDHPLPQSATPYKLMPQEVAHTCAQNIGFMHGPNTLNSTMSIIITRDLWVMGSSVGFRDLIKTALALFLST